MKKKMLFLWLCVLVGTATTHAQDAASKSFRVRYKVYLNGNPSFPIMYSDGKVTKEEVVQKVYDMLGNVTSEIKSVGKDWKKAVKFDFSKYPTLRKYPFLYAELVQSDDKSQLQIYFCPFNTSSNQSAPTATTQSPGYSGSDFDKFDQLVADGNFFINLDPREALTFKTGARQAGPLTLPFKVYLGSRDDNHASNVVTAVNLSGYYGWKWGRTGFINAPAEKAGKSHQTFFSFNLVGGLSKVDVDSTTNVNKSIKKGSSIAISPGVGFGFHYDSFAIFGVLGTDLPLGQVAGDWRYKNQLWLGFGVGFSIL